MTDQHIEPLQFDKDLFLMLHFDGSCTWDNIFTLISAKAVWIPLYLFLIYMIYRKYGWRNTLLAVVFISLGVIVADHICNFFKDFLPKLRPTHYKGFKGIIDLVNGYKGGEHGTVSAHTATTVVVALSSWLYLRRRWLTAIMAFWAMSVAYSRIYLGVHYPTDIFFGIITGVILGLGAYKLYKYTVRKLELRRQKRLSATDGGSENTAG